MGSPDAPEDRAETLERLGCVPAREVKCEVQRRGALRVRRIIGMDPVRGFEDHEPVPLEEVAHLAPQRFVRLDEEATVGRGVGRRDHVRDRRHRLDGPRPRWHR
jgi:hypothetical protein